MFTFGKLDNQEIIELHLPSAVAAGANTNKLLSMEWEMQKWIDGGLTCRHHDNLDFNLSDTDIMKFLFLPLGMGLRNGCAADAYIHYK